MGLLSNTALAGHIRNIKNAPPGLVYNRHLVSSSIIFATGGMTLTWDQGSSSLVPSLPGFETTFGISSGANADDISNFVSIVYIGCAVGAALSFLLNDRIGRLWSFRLYWFIWVIGQMIATGSSGSLGALYVARVVSGLGIGALSVTCPMSLAEIAPAEIRGLISSLYSVGFMLALFLATMAVYGVSKNMAPSPLQYQVIWFSPCTFAALVIAASFFIVETPRWLVLVGRNDEAEQTLLDLRGLTADHPRFRSELEDIRGAIAKELEDFGGDATRRTSWQGMKDVFKEALLVPSNLRRLQQACVAFALAQLSGANSVTSYLVPILDLIGVSGDSDMQLLIPAMYSLAKLFFTIIASFFFVDFLGRRMSLFVGITVQMISDIYVGVYLKYRAEGPVSTHASQGAIAMIFIHGFGWAVGLLVLPYVFGGELWPNKIRSFGSAFSQFFHWIFFFAILKATPSIMSSMGPNWGAFLFFAGWCLISFIYVFLTVPETTGLNIEQQDELFKGPWFSLYKRSVRVSDTIEGVTSVSGDSTHEGNRDSKSGKPQLKSDASQAI